MACYKTYYKSPIGLLRLTSDRENLLQIQFCDSADPTVMFEPLVKPLQAAVHWLDAYFSGQAPSVSGLSFHPSGSPFQTEVWKLLQNIPYGQTVSYGEIASVIAEKRGVERMSAQAVGQAVGANPLPVIIPCHRVIGAKGNLTGYAGGLARKVFLLDLEHAEYCKQKWR